MDTKKNYKNFEMNTLIKCLIDSRCRISLFFIVFCTIFVFSCEKFEYEEEYKEEYKEETKEEYINSKYPTKEELDIFYASYWNKPEYQQAHTAKNAIYLTKEEKEIYYYLNIVRLNPPLFAQTYASGYEGDNGWGRGYAWEERKRTLIETLSDMEPLGLIVPDEELFETAHCFAYEGGKLGITGHDRSQTSCISDYHAECCQFGGGKNGLSIIMSFLIDAGENNAELGHRRILLDSRYDKLGASIQPHKTYVFVAVLDLKRKN